MPSQLIHLAIAKRYLAKHPHQIKDVTRFLDGNVVPDLAADKAAAHCGQRSEINDILKRNLEKVSPEKFLRNFSMDDDFNKGQYLHLYVDYQYYNVFLLDYFHTSSFTQSGTDLYETTRRDDVYLVAKHGVSYFDTRYGAALVELNDVWDAENAKKRQQPGYHFVMPYTLDQLDAFVEAMSDFEIPKNSTSVFKEN